MKQELAKILFFVMILMISFGYAQEAVEEPAKAPEEISVGNIYFPRPFIQAGKEYPKGIYIVKAVYKENGPVFLVYKKDDLLFEEVAVIKKLPEGQKNPVKRFKVRKDFLKDYEYFRIRVLRADHTLFAYFLTAQKEKEPPVQTEAPSNI